MHLLAYKILVEKKDFAESMRDFVKEYGSVHTFWFGPVATVQICDYPSAAEAMIKNGAATAVEDSWPQRTSFWTEQRRFSLHTLRNFGLGRNIIEERIMYELDWTCEGSRKKDGRWESVPRSESNIRSSCWEHHQQDFQDEEKFFALKSKLDNVFDDFKAFDIFINRWTVSFPPLRRRAETLLKPQNDLMDFLANQVEKRKSDIAQGLHSLEGEGNDFVDAFLIQMEKNKKLGVASSFDDESLTHTLLDLWAAGQETTATTLKWAFAYLLMYPEVKSKVEQELRNVTKSNRPLSLADRTETPYFNAVLTEIHRCAAIFPMNLSRRVNGDISVGKYTIPNGTSINVQLSLIMSDPKYFSDFYKGRKLEEQVIPFGIGKRNCLGESLARAELYLVSSLSILGGVSLINY
ncbi:unspecific monooxygenase [Cooperia oncophora]